MMMEFHLVKSEARKWLALRSPTSPNNERLAYRLARYKILTIVSKPNLETSDWWMLADIRRIR